MPVCAMKKDVIIRNASDLSGYNGHMGDDSQRERNIRKRYGRRR